MKAALVVMYTHIEGYPPSLNAVERLSAKFSEITIIHRNTMETTWKFPSNVKVIAGKKHVHYSEVAGKNFFWKLGSFIAFVLLFKKSFAKAKPDWVIIHEPIALLSWFLISKIVKTKPRVWYHNHDVILGHESFLSYWAYKAQQRILKKLDKFSIPTESRLSFFPISTLKNAPLIIPNFPSISFFGKRNAPAEINQAIRLIFQGHISADNGLEAFVHILPERLRDRKIELHLVGPIDEEYKQKLVSLAAELNVLENLRIYGRVSYLQLPDITASCHVGLATYGTQNLMVRTMGTASNKIYEYASVGLPVIAFDRPQFRSQLEKYSWASFTDGSATNIVEILLKILNNYRLFSLEAKSNFLKDLNFEILFDEAVKDIPT